MLFGKRNLVNIRRARLLVGWPISVNGTQVGFTVRPVKMES
ncbi:hypothetical protein HMPREF1991_00270 [Hoylesella loescheii DSM 19665 = JCM 12249 = ATCC 15930]|uniref:Uncharacterized protein n=1 Tax=Hoylesella loescheii DSM 19665 = JCM 12249 = ATCC 15930 TaxID=1122985 RepID=A0A069QLF4_HOYLO|nr:hypothetical protein HMPREF1991_00270 [Hoylesella loescheii DSM 19665 = JCM 12249 = ATCC 15930]